MKYKKIRITTPEGVEHLRCSYYQSRILCVYLKMSCGQKVIVNNETNSYIMIEITDNVYTVEPHRPPKRLPIIGPNSEMV